MASNKAKFHEITLGDQSDDIDELFVDLYKRLLVVEQYLTTKGDIITYDGTNYVRLSRGTDGQVLTARSGSSAGLAWEDRASGGGGTSGGDRTYWLAGMAYGAL